MRLQNQLENLLEEVQIKLSSIISDLLGKSGRRILRALADGQMDPVQLANLGNWRLHASKEELRDALTGQVGPLHRKLLDLYLERLDLIESQMATLETSIAEALQAHQEAVTRLVEIPGIGVDSAQQIIAEIGPAAMCSGWILSGLSSVSYRKWRGLNLVLLIGHRMPRYSR